MQHFVNSLTPEQWALIVGFIAPLVHYIFDKWRNFTSAHNWILSFALPLLGTTLLFLDTNTTFTQAVPLYATVYATGQAFYAVAIRYWHANSELKTLKATLPEASF